MSHSSARRACAIAVASFGVEISASAQSSIPATVPAWTMTLDLGAFVEGNRQAVTNWLRHNSYGIAEPRHCGFDFHLQPSCDAGVNYPRVSGSGIVGGVASVRRRITNRTAVEVFAATEQSGVATGRCDDEASPRDVRCTDKFLELEFGGASFAALAVMSSRHLHLGVGPALLLANWRMKPAHLAGAWIDATAEHEPWPFFLRTQYRVYRQASFAPEQRFTGFHPSTLFMGLGFMFRPNN